MSPHFPRLVNGAERLSEAGTNTSCFFSPTAEVFDVERNELVNATCNDMQMPRVENKTIIIDDYSMQRSYFNFLIYCVLNVPLTLTRLS